MTGTPRSFCFIQAHVFRNLRFSRVLHNLWRSEQPGKDGSDHDYKRRFALRFFENSCITPVNTDICSDNFEIMRRYNHKTIHGRVESSGK